MKKYKDSFDLLPGDFLFQDSGNELMNKAIKKVTKGYLGAKMDHLAVFHSNNMVVEALPEGVVKTGTGIFLSRSLSQENLPKVMVGRLVGEYIGLIPKMLEFLGNSLGQPYNCTFDLDKNGYYCSELVYKAMKYANNGIAVFELEPMTFVNPETGETDGNWALYFQNLKTQVPEGMLGINPASISLSNHIDIVHTYSAPLLW